ncbi:hypothetical protein LP420_28890 [Massilia sp. B-10]|nr:hypothetical protein LP420_28890 [Massilia sp. B-10]
MKQGVREPQSDFAEQGEQRRAGRPASREPRAATSEFQKFIEDSTGKTLPVFGSGFFTAGRSGQTTFTPLGGAPGAR